MAVKRRNPHEELRPMIKTENRAAESVPEARVEVETSSSSRFTEKKRKACVLCGLLFLVVFYVLIGVALITLGHEDGATVPSLVFVTIFVYGLHCAFVAFLVMPKVNIRFLEKVVHVMGLLLGTIPLLSSSLLLVLNGGNKLIRAAPDPDPDEKFIVLMSLILLVIAVLSVTMIIFVLFLSFLLTLTSAIYSPPRQRGIFFHWPQR